MQKPKGDNSKTALMYNFMKLNEYFLFEVICWFLI